MKNVPPSSRSRPRPAGTEQGGSVRGTPGPQPVKQQSIADDLHARIIRGDLAPGERLPTRRELSERYAMSMATVQQALEQLARDGFVEARGAAGTFVVDRPPHTNVYALIFPKRPAEPGFVRFWTALANEAIRLSGQSRRIVPWYDINGTDNADYQRLVADTRRHRVAGLIFASSPTNLSHTPLLTEPGIPRVAVKSRGASLADVHAIHLSRSSFLDNALDHLASRRRKRVAFLTTFDLIHGGRAELEAALSRRGMSTRPYWMIGLSPVLPESARAVTHLLLNSGQNERPDAMVITDDNFVEHATAGMIDAGVRVPTDLEVVAHCNFPWPTPSVVPVRRLGYDAREVLAGAVHMIDQARRGKRVRPIELPARFEDQLTDPVSLEELRGSP